MPSRTYQVNYELNGISTNAIKAFESLKAPMSEISSQMKSLTEGMQMLNKQLESFRALSESIVFKPKINTKSFADALATMESNVKMSSMRMRASLEAALSGSASDHARVNNLLGTGNWRKMESEQRAELKSMEENMKLLKNIRDKFSSGKSDSSVNAKKNADALLSAYKDKGIDPYERASRLLKKAGIGGILNKSSNGWGLAGGNSRSKLKDFISKLEAESAELNKSIEQAAKKNQQAFGNVAKETSFNRRGSFVERMLGVSPEQLKEIQPTLNALNSLMGGVGQTQAKMREVVKKTPIPKPIAPKDLLADSDYDKLVQQQKELTERYNGISAQMQNPHTKRVETLKKQIKVLKQHNKTTASLEDELRRATGSEAAWNASSGSFKSKEYIKVGNELSNVGTKISNARKVWTEYNTKLNEWKKQPYTETIERIPEAVSKAKMASSPIAINIKGNFTSKVKDIAELSSALSSLPKSAIEIPINITMPNGIVASLSAVRKELQAIDATRGKLAKGSYKGLSKAANAVNKPNEKVVNVKAAFDGSIINTEFNAAIDSLRKLAQSNTLLVKAKVDVKGVLGDFKSFLAKLKEQAKKTALVIKAKLELSNIGKQFREKISVLKKAARTANIAIKAKFDSTGINKKFREAISKLKTTASKSVITIKAKFDTGDITKNLKQSLSGLAKSTKAAMPSIKVRLDITEAKASLQKLIAEIKAASPQTIKVGTSQSRAAIAEIARQTTSSAKAEASKNNMASAVASGAVGGRIVSSRPGFVDRLRKHMYPLTGNVSLGASTPVALDMAKGMGMMYGIGGAMNLVTGGFNDAMEYQNTMETAEEILRKTYKGNNFMRDFKDMSTEVRRVAKQTKFTAPQAADATRFMAMAGLDIPMIKSSVSPIADVAVIGDNDFGEVADKMTNIQTAFGIKPNKMRHVADAITNTFTHTNTDMMMLAESMQYAAPMAHLAGMNIEDTLAMIGIMGNSGIQASMAGTTLRMMMQNTLNPNKKQAALWKKLGVGTRDSNGNLRNMIDILADVKVAAKDKKLPMADVVSNLFRVTASAGAGALIQNIDQVKELAKQNQFVGNVSGEISARKQNTAKGMWAQMTSAFTEANLKVFEQFQGDIIEMIKAVRDYFSSSEAVENLRQAFGLIKDLMKAFGKAAKFWLGIYNTFGGFIKLIVESQFYIAQVGLAIKPIMSLVNVFGGLKNLAIGFVNALSGGTAIKKAAVTTGVIKAIASNPTNVAAAIRQGTSNRANFIPSYSEYKKKIDGLMLKQATYDFSAYNLANRIDKNNRYEKVLHNGSPLMWNTAFTNPQKATQMYAEAKRNYVRPSILNAALMLATNKSKDYGDEIDKLKSERITAFKKASEMRTTSQLTDLALMYRYHNATRMSKEDPSKRESLYVPGKNKKIDDFFSERKNRMDALREARRAEQLKNASGLNFYRASRISGRGRWGSLGRTIGGGFNAAYTALSFKNMSTGLFASLKSGFLSLLSGLGRVFGTLLSPISLFTIAIGTATTAMVYYASKHNEEIRQMETNTKKMANIIFNLPSPSKNYDSQKPSSSYFKIEDPSNSPAIKNRNKVYRTAWDDQVFKNGGVQPWKIANVWSDKLEDNSYLFGKDYKYFSRASLSGVANKDRNLSKHDSSLSRLAGSTRFNTLGSYNNDDYMEVRDMKELQKRQQLSSLYLEGASNKKTLQIQNSIIALRKRLIDKKITQDEWSKQINQILVANKLTENDINKVPRFTGDPSGLKSISDWSKFQQYWIGMRQQVLAEINGGMNTISGYYNGINELKNGVKSYSSQWWDAIKHIISGMQLTVDSAGHAVQVKFDPKSGQIKWNSVIAQIRQFNKTFQDTMRNYLNLMGQAYGAMVDNGVVGNYYKDWRKFYIEQNKHRVVSKTDARYYYSQRGYSGKALENEVNNGLWTQSGNAGGRERAKIRASLAIQRADEAKRSHDKAVNLAKEQQKALSGDNSGDNSKGSGKFTSPIADAAKDTNKQLGNNNGKDTVTARPTQINIHVDKLANFDKIQFLKGEEKDLTDALQRAVAEAFANMVPMVDSLVSNDKVVTA